MNVVIPGIKRYLHDVDAIALETARSRHGTERGLACAGME
jgi:hypothetical protein